MDWQNGDFQRYSLENLLNSYINTSFDNFDSIFTDCTTDDLLNDLPMMADIQPTIPLPTPTTITTGLGWQCSRCGIDEANTPAKRVGPDGQRSICNRCYSQVKTAEERAKYGSDRPDMELYNRSKIGKKLPLPPKQLLNMHEYCSTNYLAEFGLLKGNADNAFRRVLPNGKMKILRHNNNRRLLEKEANIE